MDALKSFICGSLSVGTDGVLGCPCEIRPMIVTDRKTGVHSVTVDISVVTEMKAM